MIPGRRAARVCHANRASRTPCCTSLGHTRKKYGLIPLRSGLEAEGEIRTTGVAPLPYTRAAAFDGPELRWPTTAATVGSAYIPSATRTAVCSLAESSAI